MNTNTVECAFPEAEDWQRAQRARGLRGFLPLMPLSAFAGSIAVVLSLWPVVPPAVLESWFKLGLLLAAVLWAVAYRVHRLGERAADAGGLRRRIWLVAASLLAGAFWGALSFVLLPAVAALEVAALALIFTAVTSLWLPLFVIDRITVLTYAAPALLPMALRLLFPPTAIALTAIGSLLLLVLAAQIVAAHLIRRMLDVDAAARRALYHRATHDALVGLANHAEFERGIRRLEAAGSGPYALVFIDLDDFKRVNDTAGHRRGDDLLRAVGVIIREEKRRLDLAARIGGDEFAILMALCSDREALRVARAVSRRIAELTVEPLGASVTASIGIACGRAGAGSTTSVVDAADRACYAAKRAGRARIELARNKTAGANVDADEGVSPLHSPRSAVHGTESPRIRVQQCVSARNNEVANGLVTQDAR